MGATRTSIATAERDWAPHSPMRRREAWLRLFLLAGAATLGARSFHDFDQSPAYWNWLLYFVSAATVAIAALDDRRGAPESAARRRARAASGVAAILFAAFALRSIPQPGRETLAAVASSAALLCFFLARCTPMRWFDVQRLIGPDPAPNSASASSMGARIGTAALAIAAAVGALLYNHRDHRWGFALWLLSLSLFAAANWPRQRAAPIDDDHGDESGPPLSPSGELAALLTILGVAALMRFLWLEHFPALIEGDEGRQAVSAEAMWAHGFPDAFGIGWNSFPNLSYMVEWSGVQLFGKSNANFRLAAALVGTLSLVPLYLWARRWWGGAVALIATLLMAINREHLLWSRWAFNNIQAVLVGALVLATFARVLRTRRTIDWVWFGYSLALGFHTYHAAKLYPALIAAATLLLALGIPGFLRRYAGGAAVGAIAFALCVGPHAVTVAEKWEILARENNRFDVQQLADSWRANDIPALRNYISTHVAGCLTSFSHYAHTREAFFAPVVAVPFWLGLCWIAWRWRDPRHLVVLIWIGGILAVGGMITSYPPWKPRLLGLLPAVCVLPALVAGRVRALLWRGAGRRGDHVFLPCFFAWIGVALWHTLDTEFVYRPFHHRGEIMTSLARAIESAPIPSTVNILGAEPRAVMRHATIAEDPRRRLRAPAMEASTVPVLPDVRGGAVYLVTRQQSALLPLLRHYYPDARARSVENMFDATELWSFTLDAAQLAGHRTLRRSAVPGGQVARWLGSVFVDQSGPHWLRADAKVVLVDANALDDQQARWLAAGWHELDLETTIDRETQPAVEWRRPGDSEWSIVPGGHFSDHATVHGLLGRYFGGHPTARDGAPIAATPDLQRIETALSFDWNSEWDNAPPAPLAARPSTMEWTGSVRFEEGLATALRLTSSAAARLFVDGALVAEIAGGHPPQSVEREIATPTGEGAILLRVTRAADEAPPWQLSLEWRQAGGDWSAFAHYRPANPATDR